MPVDTLSGVPYNFRYMEVFMRRRRFSRFKRRSLSRRSSRRSFRKGARVHKMNLRRPTRGGTRL